MIVLHVARARTDSINIRGSLGKTRAALWITGATFLYFSECNAHTPFTLFSFLCLSRLLLSFLSRCFPFAIFPYPSSFLFYMHVMLIAVHAWLFMPWSSSLSFSILDPSPPIIFFSGTDGDSSLSNCFPVSELLFSRNGNYSRTRETELSDNPLICPVITSHQPHRQFDAILLDES